MSRRTQDIPIRPRYGLSNEAQTAEDASGAAESTSKGSFSSGTAAVALGQIVSSYSEIPFLAQYPGAVPDHVLNDITPTATKEPPPRDNSLDEDDDSAEDAEGSSDPSKTPRRPNSLQCDSSFPYELEGTTGTEGGMRHFVAEDLEKQLRTTSPPNRADQQAFNSQHSTPSTNAAGLLTRHYLQTQVPQIDANVLSDIEIEAQYLAASVDNLTENLCSLLHSISSITADNVEVHKNAVNKLTDSMDANIKCMYTIMAKTEEITKSMKPTEQLGLRIREIKRLVDTLDNLM